MGARGGLIMSFFGAVFAATTMHWQWHVPNFGLAIPFVVFALIGCGAAYIIRLPGSGIVPSSRAQRVILWSSAAEGVGLFLASNLIVYLHRPELLLPAMTLVVGLHFLPIAFAAPFAPFYILGAALIVSAIIGCLVRAPAGGEIAGLAAAAVLWTAAVVAIGRDWRSIRSTARAG